jgi:hypothetical protein
MAIATITTTAVTMTRPVPDRVESKELSLGFRMTATLSDQL